MAYFSRKYLEALISNYCTSLSYILFIDNFRVYRNIYRALKAFYLIPVYLDYVERRKLVNIFILILGPYSTNIINIIKAFRRPI